jgi:hypothetical protein
MSATVEDLERRLAQVEQEVTRLRSLVEKTQHEESPSERGVRLLHEARMSQASISAAAAKAFAEMGITCEPVGIEKLREMMAACGVDPTDNAFSREIIAMREE